MRKATRPEPVKHETPESGFAGYRCPVCTENKLLHAYRRPICQQCREKFGLGGDFLDQLQHYRLQINQKEINWRQKPQPKLSGTIEEFPWKAILVLDGRWQITWQDLAPSAEMRPTYGALIKQFLDSITPDYVERLKGATTKVRRYHLLAAIGLGTGVTLAAAAITLVTAGYLAARHAEKKRREQEEAEEVEKDNES